MSKPRLHPRIIQHPFAAGLNGARLDAYHEEKRGQHTDIIIDYQALERATSEVFEREGVIYERASGHLVPSRVRFVGAVELKNRDYFFGLNALPREDPGRTIADMFSWRQVERDDIFHLLFLKDPNAPDLWFFARHAEYERLPGEALPITLERDWCPPPPMPGVLLPMPKALHRRFGGDPLRVVIDSRPSTRQLFIGGVDIQPETRPEVDFVLNVGEDPSRWAKAGIANPNDRWDNKGEGQDGMSVDEIRREAEWIIERLRAGQKVLVHCQAGMNRSSTLCCATLILLEGLSAEAALTRVRATHPWARPDSRHWLKLRWLAKINRITE